MNKYNIRDFLEPRLASYRTNLKETSFDQANKEYLCADRSWEDVYDFDAYIEDHYDPSKLPASPDAIVLGDKKLYFVEFKNQVPGDIDKAIMKRKFENGTRILKELLGDFIPRDVEYVFCIVHKAAGRRAYFDSRHIESMVVRFGLDKKNTELGNFYSKLTAEDVDFYKREFRRLTC